MPRIDPHLRRALAYVRPYAPRLVPVVLATLVGTALGLVVPYLSKLLIDDAILAGDFVALVRIVGLFVGVSLLSFAINAWSGLRYTGVSADILFDMRVALYRHLQRLSPRFYARTPLGDVVSRINGDIGEIQRITGEAALGWLGQTLSLVGTLAMLIWLDATLFLVGMLALPPALWALMRYRRELEARVRTLRERSAEIGTFLIETLQGMRTVVGLNAQEREVARFRERNDTFVDALLSMRLYTYLAGGLPGLLLSVGTAAVFLFGGWRVIEGMTTLGTFVAFMAYQMRLMGPIQGLMGIYSNVATARASLVRVHELLDTPPEVTEVDDPVHMEAARGELRLEGVRFGFGRGGEVLDGVDLEIPAGQTVAIVGASGSGKSTLADLLARFLDPEEGRIALDGVELRSLALSDTRRLIHVVEQAPFVFHATVRDNVRFGRPEATDDEIHAALDAAQLGSLLQRLPEGLDTRVGERGQELSAGERQRLALARAFLLDPAVLIMDEATGALDPNTEASVLGGYDRLMRQRTTVVITHRLALARRCDRVVVVDGGQVVEDGHPERLESLRGIVPSPVRGSEGMSAPVRVAVIDSGVNVPHPHLPDVAGGLGLDLQGREKDDYVDRLGHGTAVAAAIHEKAPEAELFVVKVFEDRLATSVPTLIRAIDRAMDHGARIINLSLGTPKDLRRSHLEAVVERTRAHGVLLVSAREHDGVTWLPGALNGVAGVLMDPEQPREGLTVRSVADGARAIVASPYPRPIPGVPKERNLQGISFAVANASGILASMVADRPDVRTAEAAFSLIEELTLPGGSAAHTEP